MIKTCDWFLVNIYLVFSIIFKLTNSIQLIPEATIICITVLHNVNGMEPLSKINYKYDSKHVNTPGVIGIDMLTLIIKQLPTVCREVPIVISLA